ncbi:MAG TPA: site-2 protease family protein [Vicinamibacteria bacterium]|nr:site-2 protease family protein [Vicinamibacteria bacterium]
MGSSFPPGGPSADYPEDPGRWDPARWARVWVVPPPPLSTWQRWGRPLVLLAVTLGSVFLAGALEPVVRHGRALLLFDVRAGLALAGGLLSILLAHEMGHYLACRYYGVDATLPHFIPSPWFPAVGLSVWQPLSLVGTFGAFIRIRGPIPNRRALFDIGVAGPLAGFLVCLPVLWYGVGAASAHPSSPDAGGLFFGEPLAFQWVSRLIHGPIPDGQTLVIGQLGLAAWFGLFVTALNLMPIGQLDGGHVTYALLRDKARLISRVGSWACVALVVFSPSWILWAILVRVLGRRHPATLDDESPVGRARVVVGLLSLAVFVVCFVPNPVVVSWSDFFEGLRELVR